MQTSLIIGIIIVLLAIINIILGGFFPTPNVFETISIKLNSIFQVLLLVGLFISYQSYLNNTKNVENSQQATLTEKSWVQVYEKIQAYYSRCPNFCNSLELPWQKPDNVTMKQGEDEYGAVISLSIHIFQSFGSVLNYFVYNNTGEILIEWLNSFIIWSTSDILYDVWNKNKFIYGSLTISFIETIFETVRKNPPQNEQEVKKLSAEICASEEIKAIFKSVKKKAPCDNGKNAENFTQELYFTI